MRFIKYIFFLLLTAGFLFTGCKKTEENEDVPTDCQPELITIQSPDTVLPSDYFPAYPGSYWNLKCQQDTTLIRSVQVVNWKPHTAYYLVSLENCGVFETLTSVIPEVTGWSPKVWGNNILLGKSKYKPYRPTLIPCFETNQGTMELVEDFNGNVSNTVEWNSLNNININGTDYIDIRVITITYRQYTHYGIETVAVVSTYYAKNIGPIKIFVHTLGHEYLLNEHFIAPH